MPHAGSRIQSSHPAPARPNVLEEAEQPERRSCAIAMSVELERAEHHEEADEREPHRDSYEIICAEARMPPSSDQLLLLAQPAITAP